MVNAHSLNPGNHPSGVPIAPPAANFPRLPSAWYLIGRTRDLAAGPISKRIADRRVVAFRTASGQLAALDARCAHQGADLSRGAVVDEAIRCPFHGWSFDVTGACVNAPGLCNVPAFARQQSYPICERHGLMFIFNGANPLFPLPFFWDCEPGEFVAGRPFHFVADCPWYVLSSNGFDVAHFQSVHDRRMLGPPEVDVPQAFARRLRVPWEVTGQSVFDRLLRQFVGRHVDVSITNWGGTLTLVTGFFRRAKSYIFIATAPCEDGRTDVNVIVFAERRRPAWLDDITRPLALAVRRLFTRGFLRDDIERLVGIHYRPTCFTSADAEMVAFYHWLAQLPETEASRCADAVAADDELSPA